MSWIPVELYRRGMIKIGNFVLSSGLHSPFYIDMRKLYSYPDLTRAIVLELVKKTPLSDIDVVAGIETAGIPLATYISCTTGLPMVYVRKEKKNHGTGSLVEGEVSDKRIIIVDDVATTGNSILKAILNLVEAGGRPIRAVVIVDREQGARETLIKQGVELYSLFKARDVFRILYENNLVDSETYDSITSYLEKHRA